MKSSIYYIIPSEEEKYQEYFVNGNIWNNNLWFSSVKYSEILTHWRGLIKEQQNYYKKVGATLSEKLAEIQEKLKISAEEETDKTKKHYKNWLLNDFILINYQAYCRKFPQREEWMEWEEVDWETSDQELANHDIYLVEQTQDFLIFNYRIPYNKKIKGLVIKYLFSYSGRWYEVDDYRKLSWTQVQITAVYSVYWNDYWYLLKANANGIIHNSPYLIDEICLCPSFTQEEYSVINTFVALDYQLKFDMWYFEAVEKGKWSNLLTTVAMPMTLGDPSQDQSSLLPGMEQWTFHASGNPDFPYFKVGEWKHISLSDRKKWEELATSKKAEILAITSNNFRGQNISNESFTNLNFTTNTDVGENGTPKTTNGINLKIWLDQEYPAELHHCKVNHLYATLFWRKKTIWQGNFWDINDLKIQETANVSGTVISFYGRGVLVAEVHETIFIKVGAIEQTNIILQTIISTIGGAATGFIKGGPAGAVVGGAIGAGASLLQAGVKRLTQTQTFREEFTVDEFQHKYIRSGTNPVSLSLEQNTELISRYQSNKRLKKAGEGNEYFTALTFGNYLTREGYNKFKFLTLNMLGGYREWFKEKLENGVQIIADLVTWYQTELPKKRMVSTGANSYGDINSVTITDRVAVASGFDNISHLGGGLYVYKDSYSWAYDENDNKVENLFPWLMNQVKSRQGASETWEHEDSDKWVYLHPRNWGPIKIDIPNHLLRTSGPHKGTCRIDYYFHFFSSHDSSNPKSELNATHFNVSRESFGNKGQIVVEVVGNLKIFNQTSGEPPQNFSNPGSGLPPGGLNPEVPLDEVDPNDPDINVPEMDNIDPTGGEPEIPPVEPDIPTEPDPVPDIDISQDQDTSQDQDKDQDTRDRDPGDDDGEKPEDFD